MPDLIFPYDLDVFEDFEGECIHMQHILTTLPQALLHKPSDHIIDMTDATWIGRALTYHDNASALEKYVSSEFDHCLQLRVTHMAHRKRRIDAISTIPSISPWSQAIVACRRGKQSYSVHGADEAMSP